MVAEDVVAVFAEEERVAGWGRGDVASYERELSRKK